MRSAMEQPFSTSKVTVEYFDPHGVYKLLGPGLVARLPLRHLHWQSHSGPLRSIETLHVELISASSNPTKSASTLTQNAKQDPNTVVPSIQTPDDGFQTATVTGRQGSIDTNANTPATAKQPPPAAATAVAGPRRHQIPGLRRTPYLKLLLVRCDDNDTYKAQTRSEIKEWVKQNTTAKKSTAVAENHDAFEWMVVHVVLPNSAAYAQPRTNKASVDNSTPDLTKTASRWGKSSATIFERLQSDFNTAGAVNAPFSKVPIDRVAQIRMGLEDVPYEMLPRTAAPAPTAAPGGHAETEREAQSAWLDLMDKFRTLILASFDVRVSQYEDDIREKDVQRSLPGWNFCTFFILKEGLAHGFESVGLVEDSLVGYDELSVGLDTVIKEQQGTGSSPATHGGSLLSFTEDLKAAALRAINSSSSASDDEDEDTVDLQATAKPTVVANDEIPISAIKKPYRDLILANNVSVFDFRCYIFARQISLLLRLGNAWSSRKELLAKLKEQHDAAMPSPTSSVAPHSLLSVPTPSAGSEDAENLSMLAEICRRTLEFVPAVSQVMREDLLLALAPGDVEKLDANSLRVVDNMVSSFAFSIAQQILAQTSTRALPIPPSTLLPTDPHAAEPKAVIPEPKTMMHPARTSSLGQPAARGPPPLSPGIFPSSQGAPVNEAEQSKFIKAGLEDLAARRADLYMLSRNILQKSGRLQGWSDGWSAAPLINESRDDEDMEDVNLDDDAKEEEKEEAKPATVAPTAGIDNLLMRTALESSTGFYRLYEVLTDKCLRHYTVAGHRYAVNASLSDLAVLKFYLEEHAAAAAFFHEATLFFGNSNWSLLELSMLRMYATSLKALGRTGEYAWQLLKFLTMAAAGGGDAKHVSVEGCLGDLLEASAQVTTEMRVPLTNFFSLLAMDGTPVYHAGQDSFSVTVRFVSLLVDALPVDSIRVRMVQKQHGHIGPPREIWLETKGATSLGPKKSTAQLFCSTTVAGVYEIDQVRIKSKNLVLFHDREVVQSSSKITKMHAATTSSNAANSSPKSKIFADPHVVLYQRTEGLDVQLTTCRDLQLDKNNCLELSLLSGWNEIKTCEIKIRAATGGLRLTTSESKIVKSSSKERTFSKPVGAGIVCFDNIGAAETITISFPFSIEQDALELCLKIEVTYTTKDGTFVFAKQPIVSTALALGVNVQDVFKHHALFSRFTVSTATSSPLHVYKSELLDSEYFTSVAASYSDEKGLPLVYPKQPISLLYRIVRKPGVAISVGNKSSDARKTTMYIKLYYSVFQDQLDVAIKSSVEAAFASAIDESHVSVSPFSRVAAAAVLRHLHATMTPYELERTALLGELATGPILGHVDWAKEFPGIGSGTAQQLAGVLNAWLATNATLSLPSLEYTDATSLMRTILIPVDIPTITIVHTADIQLQPSASAVAIEAFGEDSDPETDSGSDESDDSDSAIGVRVPIFCVNQLLPATLQLKWTRIWDTLDDAQDKKGVSKVKKYSDIEFAFEVSAPADAWLIGGRRKGHFVIPAPDDLRDVKALSSTTDSEATIPLVLIPLREGRLPYPSVDIREVQPHEQGQEPSQERDGEFIQQHHETDYRNLGETVAVVADRKRVTLSLDASGPGGGPLVLESERAQVPGRELV